MAGITGSLISLLFTLSPTMGLPFTCLAFLIVILGGLGNMTSGIFASLIVAALEVFSGYLLGPGPTTLLEFLLFVAILLFRPQGLGKGIE
jgi:branched-chain amino acid transport system permease protein